MTLSPEDDAALTIPDHLRRPPPTPEAEALPLPGHNERLSALVGELDACYDSIQRQIIKTVDGMAQAGRLLIEAKELVPHGRFKEWIKNHLKVPYRSAARWMEVARREERRTLIIQLLSDADSVSETDAIAVLDGPTEKSATAALMTPDEADPSPPEKVGQTKVAAKSLSIMATAVKGADGTITMRPISPPPDLHEEAEPWDSKKMTDVLRKIVDRLLKEGASDIYIPEDAVSLELLAEIRASGLSKDAVAQEMDELADDLAHRARNLVRMADEASDE